MARSQVCILRTRSRAILPSSVTHPSCLYLPPSCRWYCRPSGGDAKQDQNLFGYPTRIALATAIKEWSQIYEYTFTAYTNLLAHIVGVDHVFGAPRALVIQVEARPGALECNPATAFSIYSAEIGHRDDSAILIGDWDRLMDGCKRELEYMRQKEPAAQFAGALPTVLFAHSTPPVITLTQYPIYRFQLGSIHQTPLDPQMHAALTDHLHMCLESMSLGHIYMNASAVGQPLRYYQPAVMQMVRSKKGWKRVFIENEDDYWETMVEIMANQPERFTSGLRPRALWANFYHACMGISGDAGKSYSPCASCPGS